MNVQDQEERDFDRMTPAQYNEAAVKQEGEATPERKWLLTNYDFYTVNPFWDGVDATHPEEEPEEAPVAKPVRMIGDVWKHRNKWLTKLPNGVVSSKTKRHAQRWADSIDQSDLNVAS